MDALQLPVVVLWLRDPGVFPYGLDHGSTDDPATSERLEIFPLQLGPVAQNSV